VMKYWLSVHVRMLPAELQCLDLKCSSQSGVWQ
jgi:hypothetical protein